MEFNRPNPLNTALNTLNTLNATLNALNALDALDAATRKIDFALRLFGVMRSPKEYTVLSQTGGLVMALFAGLFAVFVQLLDPKPNDVTIWNVLRTLSYIGIMMNASGVFTAFILVINADIMEPTGTDTIGIRIMLTFAYIWMINCLSLSIGIFLTVIGVWVWANESHGVAVASTAFLIIAASPYSIFWIIVVGKLAFLWRMGPQGRQDYLDQQEGQHRAGEPLDMGAARVPPP